MSLFIFSSFMISLALFDIWNILALASRLLQAKIKTDFFLAMTGDQKAVDQVYAENDHLTIDNINESIKFMLAAPPNVQIHDILITPTEQRL